MEIIEINDFKNKKTYIINEDSKRLDNFNLNYKKITKQAIYLKETLI